MESAKLSHDDLVKAATGGSPDAQFELAERLFQGKNVSINPTEAIKWYRMAAEQKHLEAQAALGIRYAHGQGIPRDYVESVKWSRLAAERGHAGAQNCMGVRYATGQGVEQNDGEAVRWYRMAAEQGHAVAQFNLALMYIYGQGVEQNYQEAFVWFSLSAEQGDDFAKESCERTAEAIAPADLELAKQRVRILKRALPIKKAKKSFLRSKPTREASSGKISPNQTSLPSA
ncbi:MAG: tetratricopeptide repeat protein [Verrucomicrobiae bacterium]|nr:tetratricopeptide repeat protein [Verrucomicrobiae bacterium]